MTTWWLFPALAAAVGELVQLLVPALDIGLEAGAVQVVQQHVELGAEQFAPAALQEFEQIGLVPMSLAAVPRHAGLIEGVPALKRLLRARGLKIGSTTGCNREIMAVLAPLCAGQGFEPDNLVCAGDVAENRPAPLGMYRCFLDLAVWSARRVVKVDDTVPGLLDGRHADCWTVAVVASGNEMGLTPAQWKPLPGSERELRRQAATARLREARPDYFVDTVAELPALLDEIEVRLVGGARPRG